MRHLLVVANQTLVGSELLATLRKRLQDGPADVRVVVPATRPAEDLFLLSLGPGGGVAAGTGSHVDAFDVAQRRLERGLTMISELGFPVQGEVGDDDPMRAVDEALSRSTFDEVIISTLPRRASHWLRADLPARVHRKHGIPVTTVTAH